MRPATRLVKSGVGLAAVQVLPALERLCHFIRLYYTEISVVSIAFSIFLGDVFQMPRSEVFINSSARREPHPASFFSFHAALLHIAVDGLF